MTGNEGLTTLEKDLDKYDAVLTPDEVAEVLKVSRRTVDDYIRDGVITAFPLHPDRERKQYRITKLALIDYMTKKER